MSEYKRKEGLSLKLNPECIRDILFYLEENLQITTDLELEEIDLYELNNHLDYSIQELANTLLALSEADFIEIAADYGSNQITHLDVYRITYAGYQFIESIRPEPVWNKVKSIGKNIGSFSINSISQIAVEVISALITAQISGTSNP